MQGIPAPAAIVLILVLVLAIVLAPDAGASAADPVQEAAAYHRDFQNEGEGIAIASVAEGAVAFGQAGNLKAGGPPVDPGTLFEIGSITKVFTGILLADAVNRGTVALDDPVTRFLPADWVAADSPLRQVTLVELSTHTSGLPRLPSNLGKGGDPNDPYAAYSADRLREYLAAFKAADFVDRGKTRYSNLGAGLLGYALERASGKPYEALVRDTIFVPLGMKSSHVQRRPGEIPAEALARFATGHQGGKEVPHWHLDVLCGAGAIVSSARDLATFAMAHFSPDTPASLRAAMELAAKPHRGDVGLGWFIGKEGLNHDGGTGGFRSELRLSLPDKTATIRLINGTGPGGAAEQRGDFSAISGYWQGALDAGAAKLRLFLRVSGDGRVVLHSLDQGGQGIPAERTVCEGGSFRAVFGALGGRFEGIRDGDRLTGTWTQNGALPLTLEKTAEIPAPLKESAARRVTGDAAPIAGFWSGRLGGEQGLFLVLEVDHFDGVTEARLYSPDQTPEPMPVSKLSFDGRQLQLELGSIQAAFAAKLGDDGKLTGAWRQGPLPQPLGLVRSHTMPVRE